MSAPWTGLEPVAWVLDEAPGVPSALVSTLVCLARHAGLDGRGAYPSIATLAGCTRKSEKQVRRDLQELLQVELIRLGDQGLVSHLRGDRRPTVYDLAMERKRGDVNDLPSVSPRRQREAGKSRARWAAHDERGDIDVPSGGTSMSERGDVGVQHGGTPTGVEESLEEALKNPLEEGDSSLRSSSARTSDFPEDWPTEEPEPDEPWEWKPEPGALGEARGEPFLVEPEPAVYGYSPAASAVGGVFKPFTDKRDLSSRLATLSRPKGRQRGQDPLPEPRGQPAHHDFVDGRTAGYCGLCDMPKSNARHQEKRSA